MRRVSLAIAIAVLAITALPSAAGADYGFQYFDVELTNRDGSTVTQAGSHPYAMTTRFMLNYTGPLFEEIPDEEVKDVIVQQIAGFTGDATAVPRCSILEFLQSVEESGALRPGCKSETAVGTTAVSALVPIAFFVSGVYNLEPPPGVLTRLGFEVLGTKIVLDVTMKEERDYNLVATTANVPQVLTVFGTMLELWGDPSDPGHDAHRAPCTPVGAVFGVPIDELEIPPAGKDCPVEALNRPFLTAPRACEGPLTTHYETASWPNPSTWVEGDALTHDNASPPNPQGFSGCGKLGFSPSIEAQPTSKAAQSPTGLDFNLDIGLERLVNPVGLAESDIRKTVVTLPEGFSTNPSVAEGLEVCTEADLKRETVASDPGEGCPNASKIGTVEVESPLVDEAIDGSLYIAEPYENPVGSLIALYVVLKNPRLGINITQPLEVRSDPQTGRVTTIADEMPQLPFSSFRLRFREGTRSPLATPPTCGPHEVKAEIHPWSGGPPVPATSTFEIVSGPNGGPCPTGGLPPFKPGLTAGTINNAAGKFSPFNLRLSRNDGEQEFTRFSIKLPPGIAGILAGIPRCPDAAIEAAKSKAGAAEIASPSCPAASQVGRTLAGAGVGPGLTYAPGKIYLAGPYGGAPISLAAITAAKVGPFDLGTVVIRQAFQIDRNTAEVFLDPVGSDPIPHIIDGIIVHARDIRAYVDRPNFVFNPTNCERTSVASTVLGSGLDFASPHDDNPVVVSTPFQAADCAALRFNPRLTLRLIGGTKRGGHPRFRADLRTSPGEANIGHARVTLPGSAFLDQSHIGTVCTRVQFARKQCPAASVYGHARAVTPILDGPLTGPVYLRSSEHKLPDLVAALRSPEGIEFDLVGRIDSVKGKIRNTFEVVPDAPVSLFTLNMRGGNKGLIINSRNLCVKRNRNRANVEFTGQNGKIKDFRPVMKVRCAKKRKRARSSHRRSGPRLSFARGVR